MLAKGLVGRHRTLGSSRSSLRSRTNALPLSTIDPLRVEGKYRALSCMFLQSSHSIGLSQMCFLIGLVFWQISSLGTS